MRKKVLTLCLAVVVALTFVVGATPTSASAGEVKGAKRVADKVALTLATVTVIYPVIRLLATFGSNFKKDFPNVPKTLGRSVLNGVGTPVEIAAFVVVDVDPLPTDKNNALADNNYIASATGWGLVGLAFVEPIGITPWLARGGPIAVGVVTGVAVEAITEDIAGMQISYEGLGYNKNLALK